MNTSIRIDSEAVLNYNQQTAENNAERSKIICQILDKLNTLTNNVSGSKIRDLIYSIEEDLQSINNSIRTNGEQLSEYISKQMKNYEIAYEDAEVMITKAIAFIQAM